MKKLASSSRILTILLLVAFVAVFLIQTQQNHTARVNAESKARETPKPHIISLVPSVTEALFMLGLGDHLVGRSTYCDFPSVVTNLPALGSLGNVNIEAIARLKPDFVILSDAQAQSNIHTALANLRINHLGVPANSLDDIYQGIWELAERFDAQETARLWLEHMDAVNTKAKASAPATAPRILVCAGRDAGSFDRLYIAGKGNFYEGIVSLVGGVNAYTGDLPYPMVSFEGIVQMNPDIVVDIVIGGGEDAVFDSIFQWGKLSMINAVKTGDVHVLTESWAVRPGPRIDQIIQTFAYYMTEWSKRP